MGSPLGLHDDAFAYASDCFLDHLRNSCRLPYSDHLRNSGCLSFSEHRASIGDTIFANRTAKPVPSCG
ncbi:MAG: hypothetical protein WCP58_08795 [bacterium]